MLEPSFAFPTCPVAYPSRCSPHLSKRHHHPLSPEHLGPCLSSLSTTHSTSNVSAQPQNSPFIVSPQSDHVSPRPLPPNLVQTSIISCQKNTAVPQLMSLLPFLPCSLHFPGPTVPFTHFALTTPHHLSSHHSLCPHQACHYHLTTSYSRSPFSLEEAQPGR